MAMTPMDLADTLEFFLHGVHIGTLQLGTAPDAPAFRYSAEYTTRKDAIALGRQFPLEATTASSASTIRWIEGLLPEGDRRADLARQLGLPRMSSTSLIREIGMDCAGAVQIVPPDHSRGSPGYLPLTMAEIAEALDDLHRRPIRALERGARLSIAGAQEKIVLARRPDGTWAWPTNGAPSTHIVKPQTERFTDLVNNEHLCMSVAKRAGLPVANVERAHFGEHLCLVIERFDRTPQGERIHQEDFAQALGAREKYQQFGGPGLRECFRDTGVGGWALWDQVMYAWMIGDEDKHAKNFSIIYEQNESPALAPIYDAVCTLRYRNLERGMAMRIGGTYHVRAVDEAALRNQATRCALDPEEAIARTYRVAQRVRSAIEALEEEGNDVSILKEAGTLERCEAAREWVH